MGGFANDNQRKAVMATLNPSGGSLQTMIGAPISSSMITTPGKESAGIKKYVNSVFDRYKESKVIGKSNDSAKQHKEMENKKALELKKKQITMLQEQIKLLQSGKLTDHERDRILGKILEKDRGLLPKEVEQKLKEQRDELKKNRTNPIMPDGISPTDKKVVESANVNYEEGIGIKDFQKKALLKEANDEPMSKKEKEYVKSYNENNTVPDSNHPLLEQRSLPTPETRRSFEDLTDTLKQEKEDIDLDLAAAAATGDYS